MKAALIDTNILSLFFRNHPRVIALFQAYITEHSKVEDWSED